MCEHVLLVRPTEAIFKTHFSRKMIVQTIFAKLNACRSFGWTIFLVSVCLAPESGATMETRIVCDSFFLCL